MKVGIWILIGAGLLFFAGANAHLVYVAFNSQPACVPHDKGAHTGARSDYRAAKPAC